MSLVSDWEGALGFFSLAGDWQPEHSQQRETPKKRATAAIVSLFAVSLFQMLLNF
jgi:hypothetical protein